jgi:hypothetical protein
MLGLLCTVVALMMMAAFLGFTGAVASPESMAWFLIVTSLVLVAFGFFTDRTAI